MPFSGTDIYYVWKDKIKSVFMFFQDWTNGG